MDNLKKDNLFRPFVFLSILSLVLLMSGCASTNLRKAIYQNDPNQVKQALAEGKDVNKYYVDAWTPLLNATRQGNLEIVKILLDHGADIQARTIYGWGALLIASRYGYSKIAEYLIDNGAYVHTRNNQDYTPLMLAAYGGHLEIVKILASSDVRLDVKNKEGKTAMYYAASNKREDMVKYLIQEGGIIENFETGGDDLFATAVIHKTLAAINENREDIQEAEKNYRTAADYFERAKPELLKLADYYERERKAQQVGSLLASVLGLVASTVDLANIREGNPTYYSNLVPQAEAANMDAYEIVETICREKSKDCSNECYACRRKASELKKKNKDKFLAKKEVISEFSHN